MKALLLSAAALFGSPEGETEQALSPQNAGETHITAETEIAGESPQAALQLMQLGIHLKIGVAELHLGPFPSDQLNEDVGPDDSILYGPGDFNWKRTDFWRYC